MALSPEQDSDHAEVVRFLRDWTGDPGAEPIGTHGALVFLSHDEALKIKRPVAFAYMDFSTLEKRRAACERELGVNRPNAPDIYLAVVAITREADGRLALDGAGQIIEWAVHMRRFREEDVLARIADKEGISRELAVSLAEVVHAAHARAPVHNREWAVGELIGGVVRDLHDRSDALGEEGVAQFEAGAERQLARAQPVLARRAAAGQVRRCHGDLHLDNIVLWKGQPTLFDALEFDERLATIDTLYDLAFLLYSLDRHRQPAAASLVLNRYLWRGQSDLDLHGLAALPLFLALRAGIVAITTTDKSRRPGTTADRASELHEAARLALATALARLSPPPPRLIAIGGLSGTGKSTLAAALAPDLGARPGALHLRTDLERKAMFAARETERLPADAYTPEVTARVYRALFDKAQLALAAGSAVVLDAVFERVAERAAAEALARELGVPFDGIWLEADAATMLARVSERRHDASDATAEVVAAQLARAADRGAWHGLAANAAASEVLVSARNMLGVETS